MFTTLTVSEVQIVLMNRFFAEQMYCLFCVLADNCETDLRTDRTYVLENRSVAIKILFVCQSLKNIHFSTDKTISGIEELFCVFVIS